MDSNLRIIGRHVTVDFPQWNYTGLEAKVDTGAYSSSLHCHRVEAIQKGDGQEDWVRLWLLDPSCENYRSEPIEVPVRRRKTVRSSNGVSEERIFIHAAVRLFGSEISADFSLADRTGMKYAVLLGRKVLKGRFLVDVSRTGSAPLTESD
ncbi:MAG: RimK/LysX family protein [Balneolaceae bacterium]|nr:RimK/LysX family protein [Balneolaceae bacterium]